MQSYLHNEAGQVSKGTALCTRVKWGLSIWQKNRSVNPAASLTLVYTLTQISKLNGDQRGQWSSCMAAWMHPCHPPPPVLLMPAATLRRTCRLQNLSSVRYVTAEHTINLFIFKLLWAAFDLPLPFTRQSRGNIVCELVLMNKLRFVFML